VAERAGTVLTYQRKNKVAATFRLRREICNSGLLEDPPILKEGALIKISKRNYRLK